MDDLEIMDDDIVGQINWGNIYDENLFAPLIADTPLSDPSPDSYFVEIENLLMEDSHRLVPEAPSESGSKEYYDKFLAEILVGEGEDDSNPSGQDVINAGLGKDKVDATANDPISKKRTRMHLGPVLISYHKTYKHCAWHVAFRQMRNRDAAAKSRERKKMHVKDLEMKTRYLEGECRRLGYLLHCCYAENHALRLCLQSSSAFGASMTKLESAVLLLESLLLVSLLWFVGIICQLSLPLLPWLILEVVSLENVEQKGPRGVAQEGTRNKILAYFVLQSFVKSRRFRASKTRMKMNFLVV